MTDTNIHTKSAKVSEFLTCNWISIARDALLSQLKTAIQLRIGWVLRVLFLQTIIVGWSSQRSTRYLSLPSDDIHEI